LLDEDHTYNPSLFQSHVSLRRAQVFTQECVSCLKKAFQLPDKHRTITLSGSHKVYRKRFPGTRNTTMACALLEQEISTPSLPLIMRDSLHR